MSRQMTGKRITFGLGPPAAEVFADLRHEMKAECEASGRADSHLSSIDYAEGLILRWCGKAKRVPLTRSDLMDFVAWCRLHTASRGRSIHNALVILRTALRWAELPVPKAPVLNLPARAPKTYSRAELRRLLAQLPLGGLARTVFEVGLRTGARAVEVRRIQIGDLDLQRRTLILRRKGRAAVRGSEEVLPLSPGLVRVLRAYAATLPANLETSAPLLATRRGGKWRALQAGSLRRQLERAAKKAKIPPRTTTGWTRAQAATLAREAGQPLAAVAGTLGHVDAATTLRHYDESGREALERWKARAKAGRILDRVLRYGKHTVASRKGTKTSGKRRVTY
jgi:integrase